MQRIVVVGPPCSGKSTLAAQIAARLHVPHIELDGEWWGPNWTGLGADRFRERLHDLVAVPRWVIDGNYFAVGARDIVYPAADTIVWLDMPRSITVPRALRRTMSRAILRTRLWSDNREPFHRAFRPLSTIRKAVTTHPGYNREVAACFSQEAEIRRGSACVGGERSCSGSTVSPRCQHDVSLRQLLKRVR